MKVRRLLAFGVIIVGLVALGVSLVPLVSADPNAPEAILAIPTDDTYVVRALPDSTHGGETVLSVIRDCLNNRPSYITFLRFPIPPTEQPSYRLILSNTLTTEGPPDISLYGATTNWTEGSLKWNNLVDFVVAGTVDIDGYPGSPLGTQLGAASNTLFEFNSLTFAALKTYIDNQRNGAATHVAFALVATSCPEETIAPDQLYASKEHEQGPAPLQVELASSELTADNARVEITWTTASETDNEGFNIYRSESTDGEFVKVNDVLITARGNASTGATYTFTDEGVNNGVTYYYRLEAVSTDGRSEIFDLGSITPRRPGKGR